MQSLAGGQASFDGVAAACEDAETFWLIRERLADQRRRGRPFHVAWSMALRSLPARGPTREDRADRSALRAALRSTRWAWERAYIGAPATRVESAAVQLFPRPGERTDLQPPSHTTEVS